MVALKHSNELIFDMRAGGIVEGVELIEKNRAVSWDRSGRLILWDLSTGMQMGPSMPHEDVVYGVGVMPNNRILSWSRDNTLRLWDLATGQQTGPAMRHKGYVMGAIVTPDSHIISWSTDNTIRYWSTEWPKGSLFEAACTLLGDYSTDGISDKYSISIESPICPMPDKIPLPDWSGKIERVEEH